MLRTGIITLAVASLTAAPVQAQSHQQQHGESCPAHHMDAGHGMKTSHGVDAHRMDGAHRMDASHRYAPGMLLKHADALKLTTDQVAQLEGMKATHMQDCARRMAVVEAAESAAAELLAAEQPDLARYEASLLEAAKQKVDCQVDMARLTQRSKALLSAEQKQYILHMGHSSH